MERARPGMDEFADGTFMEKKSPGSNHNSFTQAFDSLILSLGLGLPLLP